MKLVCEVQNADTLDVVRKVMPRMRKVVQDTAERVAATARSLAPVRSGDLRRGIVASPWEENSVKPYKIGRQVYMDHRMNDTFVKTRKDGKRYYYPASQEYGFRVHQRSGTRKVDGKYFMRDAADVDSSAFFTEIEDLFQEVLSD